MTVRTPLLATLLLAGCATTPKGPPAGDTVELRFTPKPGAAQIEDVEVRTLRTAGKEQVRRTVMHATASVLEVPEGFALVNENVRFESAMPNPLLDLAAKVAESFRLIVDPQGEIVSIHGLEELQPAMMQWLGGLRGSAVPPAVLEQMRATIVQITDPELVAERTASDWFVQVGAWNGKTLEIGRTYESPAPVAYRYRAIERVPCTEGATGERCVRLELESQPSPEQLERAEQAMAPLLRMLDPGATHGPVEVNDRVELVVEPETLDAHWMEKRRQIRMSVTAAGQTTEVERDEVDTTTWRYE